MNKYEFYLSLAFFGLLALIAVTDMVTDVIKRRQR